MMENKLKPCPFCGGIPTMISNQQNFDSTSVKIVCGLCLASIQRHHSNEKKAVTLAVMSWNRRVNDD